LRGRGYANCHSFELRVLYFIILLKDTCIGLNLERERSYEVPFTILVPLSLDPCVELYEETKGEGFCEQLSSIAMTCNLMHNIVIKK
jgi:hypothetical protein